MIDKPTLVHNATPLIGKIHEIVCGDSSTVVRSDDGDKVYAWGRGYSEERQIEVSRFRPKELSSIETQHRFLLTSDKHEENHDSMKPDQNIR